MAHGDLLGLSRGTNRLQRFLAICMAAAGGFVALSAVGGTDALTACRASYLSVSAATPGNSIPARNSSDAPPPVEICEIWSATPADLMAFSESPPPTTDVAPEAATAFASATVPRSNGFFSKTPMGPFQITVLAVRTTCE